MVSMSGLIETRGEGYEPHCRRGIRRSPAAGTPVHGAPSSGALPTCATDSAANVRRAPWIK